MSFLSRIFGSAKAHPLAAKHKDQPEAFKQQLARINSAIAKNDVAKLGHRLKRLEETIYSSNLPEELKDSTFCGILNAHDRTGKTLLSYAVEWRSSDAVITALIEAGANPNLANIDPEAATPLMCAAYRGNENALKVLLENGASVHVANANGNTALHFASHVISNGKVVNLLLDAGADPRAIDGQGSTALDIMRGHVEREGSLYKNAADVLAAMETQVEKIEAGKANILADQRTVIVPTLEQRKRDAEGIDPSQG